MSDPCDNRYHTEVSNGFNKEVNKLISYLPNNISLRPGKHANFRQEKSKYLKEEDARDDSVRIKVPQTINLQDSSSFIFEVGTVEMYGIESILRVCVRLKDRQVEVTNTDNNYSEYEYCLVIEVDPENPNLNHAKLVTVYLNHYNDSHSTLKKSNYVTA